MIVTLIGWLTIFTVGALACIILPMVAFGYVAERRLRGGGVGPLIMSLWVSAALLLFYIAGWIVWFVYTFDIVIRG